MKEAKAILEKLSDSVLVNMDLSSFEYDGHAVVDYCWEDDDKFVFAVYYLPKGKTKKDYSTKELEKYFAESWIVNKKTLNPEPWYE